MGGATEAPFAAIGLAALLDGVTEGVTFRGRAADDGGGMPTALEESVVRLQGTAGVIDEPTAKRRKRL